MPGVIFCTTLLLLSSIYCSIAASTPPGVVALGPVDATSAASKIDKTGYITLQDVDEGLRYNTLMSIGTPPQDFFVQVDTGSPDTWIMTADACKAAIANGSEYGGVQIDCGGTYNSSKSSTYKLLQPGGFDAQYQQGGNDSGDLVSETVRLGTLSATNTTIDVVTKSGATNSILGLGPRKFQPTVLDKLLDDGLINTRAFSLFLDDLDTPSTSILFGGLDTEKYIGNLTLLPSLTYSKQNFENYFVIMSSITVTDTAHKQDPIIISSPDMAIPVLLDTGIAVNRIPNDLYNTLVRFFGGVYDEVALGYLFDCALSEKPGSIDFGFGGRQDGEAIISVPFSEVIVPSFTLADNFPTFLSDGRPACSLAFDPASANPNYMVMGASFLRSAYIVFDQDNRQIAIAQTKFGATDSKVVAFEDLSALARYAKALPSAMTTTNTPPGATAPALTTATGGTAKLPSPDFVTAALSGTTTTLPPGLPNIAGDPSARFDALIKLGTTTTPLSIITTPLALATRGGPLMPEIPAGSQATLSWKG